MKKLSTTRCISSLMLLMLMNISVYGQKYNLSQKAIISNNIDSIMKCYLQKSNLLEPGGIKQNDEVMSEFKSLFSTNAMIYDDILPKFDTTEVFDNPYKLTSKPFREYFRGMVYEFPQGFIIINKNINVNYFNLDSGKVKVALERKISGVSATEKYRLHNHDTLLITLDIANDLTVKISEISSLNKSNQLKVLNDVDLDGVIDSKDECPNEKGKRYLKGCPDRDNDGIPDKNDDCPNEAGLASNRGCPPSTFTYSLVVSGGLSYHFNKHILQTPTTGFGYELMDKVESTYGNVKNPGVKTSVAFNGNLAYYFGKKKFKKNFGLAAGIFITNYTDKYLVSGIKYFYKGNDGVDDYRRIITVKEAEENINFSMMNFSLQLKYRGKLRNTKFATEIAFGPGYITSINGYSYKATIDYEGIYQYNSSLQKFEYTQSFNPQNTNWILVGELINAKDNSLADFAYELYQRNSTAYDFGLNRTFDDKNKGKLSKRNGLSINAGIDILYHLSSKLAAKAGASIIYANLANKAGDYKITDKISDKYNSIYESKAKSNYFSWGVGVGLAIGI